MNRISRCLLTLAAMAAFSSAMAVGTWQRTTNRPPAGVAVPILLTDGTVIAHNGLTRDWYKLTPDETGSYVNGTWAKIAQLPSGYGPLYYASAVLMDGRVIVIGGEYNLNQGGVWTNKGAIYDPLKNTWTSISPPPGWANVGDAQCSVMPDGRFLLAMPFDTRISLFEPVTMTWTNLGSIGKRDRHDEENWTLLPEGTILTVDALNAPNTEKYIPWQDTWIDSGKTTQRLEDPGSQEIGPAVLRPDGTVLATGATGHNSIYVPGALPTDPGTWLPAPDFPNKGGQLDIADGPAVLLPNGNVLCDTSPGIFNTPTYFFEFDRNNNLLDVPSVPRANQNPSYVGNFLVLPTGQVMFTDFSNDVQIYTPDGAPEDAWRPTITSAPTGLFPNQTFTLYGTQLNGLSQASMYGDDSSNATNYPLVRIRNNASGKVKYCRTFGFSTMAVATGAATVSTKVKVPSNIESGPSTLEVVTNGITSAPMNVTVVPTSVVPTAGG